MTLQQNPFDRILPVNNPIFPVPISPTVLAWRLKPKRPSRRKFPSRTRLYALWYLRTTVMIIPTVNSATASGEYAGTRATWILYLAAANRSMLLWPAHRRATNFWASQRHRCPNICSGRLSYHSQVTQMLHHLYIANIIDKEANCVMSVGQLNRQLIK